MRFCGVSQISWEIFPWKHLSLVSDEEVISLSHAKVYVFSDSVLCLGKVNQNPTSNTVWEQQLGWFKDSSQYRTLDTIDGEPMEFEWNMFPGFTTLQPARAGTSCEMTQQKTRSTSSPFLISSLSRTFTSGRASHTVTGTGRKKVIKNTTLQINSKRSAGNEDTRTFTIDLFVIHGSENPC